MYNAALLMLKSPPFCMLHTISEQILFTVTSPRHRQTQTHTTVALLSVNTSSLSPFVFNFDVL